MGRVVFIMMVFGALCSLGRAAPEKRNVPPPPVAGAVAGVRQVDAVVDIRKRGTRRGDGAARLRRELDMGGAATRHVAPDGVSEHHHEGAVIPAAGSGAGFAQLLADGKSADTASLAVSRAASFHDGDDAFRTVKKTCLSVWVSALVWFASVLLALTVMLQCGDGGRGTIAVSTFSRPSVWRTTGRRGR